MTAEGRYKLALVSIAANTCCGGCQEAAAVALSALNDVEIGAHADSEPTTPLKCGMCGAVMEAVYSCPNGECVQSPNY